MTRALSLPRRDAGAVQALAEVARTSRPTVLARERVLPLREPLVTTVPGGALIRGSVVSVSGQAGEDTTALAFQLAAAATDVGEWAAAVDPSATLGGLAAVEAGVVAERFAVIRGVAPARWAAVVAALLEGVSVVMATTPPSLGMGDARRLAARARERGAVLVVNNWPVEVGLRLYAETSAWSGLDQGSGWLGERVFKVRADEHGIASHPRPLAGTG